MKLLSILTLLAFTQITHAESASKVDSTSAFDVFTQAKIESMKALPIHGLQMVNAGGKTFFMSDNGRFVILGTLLDVWNKQFIANVDQVDQIANRIDLSKLKLNIDDLGPVTYGSGKPQVVVFVDPRCHFCLQVQQQMAALKEHYTFKLVLLPVLGQESQNLVTELGCLLQTDGKQKAVDSLMSHQYETIGQVDSSTCNREAELKTRVTAKLFGINAVPFLIAPDGRTLTGAPKNLSDWLDKHSDGRPVPVKSETAKTAKAESQS